MDEHTKPLDGRRVEAVIDDKGKMGRINRIDPYEIASRLPRNEPRFVHPSDFADRSNVWRFVLTGEAFTTEEGLTNEQMVEYIDRVFSGEQNPTLPVVSYEITEVNGEPYEDESPRVEDQEGG